jgi:hypothetical protein
MIPRSIPLPFALSLLTCAAPAEPRFERRAFDLSQGIWAVDALDADGDGKLDFVADRQFSPAR